MNSSVTSAGVLPELCTWNADIIRLYIKKLQLNFSHCICSTDERRRNKLYRKRENCSREAALFVVVRGEGWYLTAGDLDLWVRLTFIGIFKYHHLIDMICVATEKLSLLIKIFDLKLKQSSIYHHILSMILETGRGKCICPPSASSPKIQYRLYWLPCKIKFAQCLTMMSYLFGCIQMDVIGLQCSLQETCSRCRQHRGVLLPIRAWNKCLGKKIVAIRSCLQLSATGYCKPWMEL